LADVGQLITGPIGTENQAVWTIVRRGRRSERQTDKRRNDRSLKSSAGTMPNRVVLLAG